MNATLQTMRNTSRNASFARRGVSSHLVSAASTLLDTGIDSASALQRTFGNAALGRMGGNDGNSNTPRGNHNEPDRGARARESIVQRVIAAGEGARAPSPTAPRIQQRQSSLSVQRLMSSQTFRGKVVPSQPGGQLSQLFVWVAQSLRYLDSVPLTQQTIAHRSQWMQAIYTHLYKWLNSDAAAQDPNRAAVELLMQSITDDMREYRKYGVQNLANTAVGNQAETPSKMILTAPTKEQEDAIQVIEGTDLIARRKAHAKDMILNPSMIQQGAFGVCGLTSVLFVEATHNPKRFAEMIKEAWAARQMRVEWLPVFFKNATPEQKKSSAEVEYLTSQWLVRRSVGQTQPVKQKILNTNDPNQKVEKEDVFYQVYQKQLKFSDSFDIKGWENTFGHFAMTTGALTYLLNTVGSKPAYKVRIRDFDRDYQAAKAKAGTGTILASVTNSDFYNVGGKEVDDAFIKTRAPKYVHWVTLKGVEKEGEYFKLHIWTWTADWVAKVHKDVIKTHIYSLIAAEADN